MKDTEKAIIININIEHELSRLVYFVKNPDQI